MQACNYPHGPEYNQKNIEPFSFLGLFQPDGNEQMSNMGFNQNMSHLQNPITELRNPEGERPTSKSTTVQSETRGNFALFMALQNVYIFAGDL